MPVSAETYERVALEDGDETWELHCGVLRSKPPMTASHGFIGTQLAVMVQNQLNVRQYVVSSNHARLRNATGSYFVPDVVVMPRLLVQPLLGITDQLEVYRDPMPLVVEVWSPSTATFDVETKVSVYRQRGDHEIWHLQPYERTLRRWMRQPDGSYVESVVRGGTVTLAALPTVTVDLDALFAL